MSNFPYLVALALLEQQGERLMPLGGKSVREAIDPKNIQIINFQGIALELLVRVLDRSEESSIRRANGKKSLLILQIPMKPMQAELPKLKSEWLKTGNTKLLIYGLNKICDRMWYLSFVRYDGLKVDLIEKENI